MEEIKKDIQPEEENELLEEIRKMSGDNDKSAQVNTLTKEYFENVQTGEDSHSHHHSSSSHHHSSSSSGHHRKHHQGKKSKFKRFIRKSKKKLPYVFVCAALFVLLLVGVIIWEMQDKRTPKTGASADDSDKVEETTSSIIIEIPFFEEEISLVEAPIMEYMNADVSVPAGEIYSRHKSSGRLDVGLPVKISYDVHGIPQGISVEEAEVLVAEDNSFTNPMLYPFEGGKASVNIYYLKTNTQYYYRINLTFSNETITSAQGSFRTADTPRILSIDGIANVRDIGNWMTVNGKRIQQGLLYRGTELDGAVEANYTITAEGVKDMLTVLGIHTDMDLRASTDNEYGTDALGPSVNHIYYNALMYTGIFEEQGKSAVREIFADLANESNYPVYLHCTYGLDRTGTICYLLEALLGVSEDDLMREYQLSAMYHRGVADEEMERFVNQLKALEGSTMQQKVEGYLLSIGVTVAEIQSIRDIFLIE